MKKRILNLSFFIFSCLILSNLFIKVSVKAEGGATGGGGNTNAGNITSDCSSWPYKGEINNKNTMLRGVRITVVDNDGKVKSGSISVDYVKNTGVTSISNVYYSETKTTKTMYLKYGASLNWTHGTVSFKRDEYIASYIISSFGKSDGGDMGQNIKNLYNAYVNGEDWAKRIISTIYTDTKAGSFSANDVVLFEPITYVKICNSAGGSDYMYGTAYELNAQYNSGNIYGGAAITGHIAKALYFKGDKISSLTDDFPEPTDTNDTYPGKEVTYKNGWGMGALWIGKIAKKCDINVNNNTGDDKKYNWTYWDGSCDADGDGDKEGCWKKQPGGCCDQVELTDEILNKYPQCAPCEPSNKTYINGKNISSLNAITCDADGKKITNYRGTGNINETTPKYCLANNNLLVGIIKGKRYGCEITDSLFLPKEYGDSLKIGQYFVWPTSKTLQKLGNFDLRYPLTRTSNITCVAYKYNSGGQLEYVNLTSEELEKVKDRFKTGGNLNLTFNGDNNGKIIQESQKSSFKNTGNNLFTGNISTVYTLEEVKGTNGVYAYYDQEKLEYTKTIISSRINKYIQYGFPIIPFGNHNDKNVSITYGINFEDIDFSKLKSYSGSYVCSKSKKKRPPISNYCKCEPGTLYEGLDLTPYFNNKYDSWLAECSRVRDLKCNDVNTELKCPNDNTINITNCVKNNITKGYNSSRSYELCVASECNCSGNDCLPKRCKGNNCNLDIIYRPIFLNNPFPSIKGNKRAAGANWGGKNALNSDGLGTKYITSTASKMYQGQAMYTFTLTPNAIKEIKNYNKAHKYDDFELSCGENQYCTSDVLRGSFIEYLTGGTCQLQTNAKIRGSNDCRLTALNQ